MVTDVLGEQGDEERLIRVLAWASFSAARRFARIVADVVEETHSKELPAEAA